MTYGYPLLILINKNCVHHAARQTLTPSRQAALYITQRKCALFIYVYTLPYQSDDSRSDGAFKRSRTAPLLLDTFFRVWLLRLPVALRVADNPSYVNPPFSSSPTHSPCSPRICIVWSPPAPLCPFFPCSDPASLPPPVRTVGRRPPAQHLHRCCEPAPYSRFFLLSVLWVLPRPSLPLSPLFRKCPCSAAGPHCHRHSTALPPCRCCNNPCR